jgi:hypothetical protein
MSFLKLLRTILKIQKCTRHSNLKKVGKNHCTLLYIHWVEIFNSIFRFFEIKLSFHHSDIWKPHWKFNFSFNWDKKKLFCVNEVSLFLPYGVYCSIAFNDLITSAYFLTCCPYEGRDRSRWDKSGWKGLFTRTNRGRKVFLEHPGKADV